MSNLTFPADLKYSDDHEWLAADGRVGVSDFAQNALGDLTFIELPAVGDTFEKGQEFGTLESTKSVSPLLMPVSGKVVAVNEALADAPELVNQSPYADGWLIKIENIGDASHLMDVAAYQKHVESN